MQTRVASDIELIVLQWLDRHKIDYQFETSLMGGFSELGGAVLDILLPERRLAWRIMGSYWYRGVAKTGSDIIQKENLAAMGLTVVDLWEEDLLNKPEETLTKALRGEEML